MEINLSQTMRELLLAFFLLILPWIVIVVGILVNIDTLLGPGWTAWFYVLAITWFGSGVIFFAALKES